jgi:hypothetical protein
LLAVDAGEVVEEVQMRIVLLMYFISAGTYSLTPNRTPPALYEVDVDVVQNAFTVPVVADR